MGSQWSGTWSPAKRPGTCEAKQRSGSSSFTSAAIPLHSYGRLCFRAEERTTSESKRAAMRPGLVAQSPSACLRPAWGEMVNPIRCPLSRPFCTTASTEMLVTAAAGSSKTTSTSSPSAAD